MSVHNFSTQYGDDEIVVTMGWDRPLRGFFMTITRIDPSPEGDTEDEEEHFLFNNLEQHITHPKDINGYLFELEHRGIDVPVQMTSEVLMDGANDVGNKIVDHRYVNGKYVREQTL
ncbi:MAG: hypothetical protein JAY80_13720 [Candidatus Thiodiazotropha lotti]|nr:hypothetical protein [Candidatus Thiodiazotropha lotti]MCW4216751.1 hypothetical protein [Candidatus Thiodiazotropha lotti]